MTSASIKREGDHAVIRIPMSEVHDLRVALEECPCKAPKSINGIERRKALASGLAKLEARG